MEEEENQFTGFMPMISNVNVSPASTMLSTQGDLIRANTINIVTKDGSNYVFSIDPSDLMRLVFLLFKVASEQA